MFVHFIVLTGIDATLTGICDEVVSHVFKKVLANLWHSYKEVPKYLPNELGKSVPSLKFLITESKG